ncbi:response regulator [Planctomycetota bacterium]
MSVGDGESGAVTADVLMAEPLRALLVEDSENDALLVLRELERQGFDVTHARVMTAADMREALESEAWDVILSDYVMSQFSGPKALALARELAPDLPFMVVSGEISPALAVGAMRLGAQDYVMKDDLHRLGEAIRRELRDAVIRARARATERERLAAQDAPRREKELAESLVAIGQAIVLVLDQNGCIVQYNPYLEELSGHHLEEVRGRDWIKTFLPERDHEPIGKVLARALSGIPTRGNVNPIVTKDGCLRWIEWFDTVLEGPEGSAGGLLCIGHDVTRREGQTGVLRAVHGHDRLPPLLREVTQFLQAWLGWEAVAIRLRDGDDFPYFVTRGFTSEFVEAERSLCEHDPDGNLVRDPAGNPVLACMCGNILCGRTNPELPFFTETGSFWTNSTTALLATTIAADRQARTRNRCNSEGYESVVLIPLRSGGETLGLLQLNDRRSGLPTLSAVRFLEGLGATIGMAISRLRAKIAREKRVKELTCLSSASRLMLEPGRSRDEVLKRVVELIPTAFRFPEAICARVTLGRNRFQTDGFRETPWALESDIRFGTEQLGSLVVCALDKQRLGPFVEEERSLLANLARDIGAFARRCALEEELSWSQRLETLGRLAGGVAHDFNNMLSVISGYTKVIAANMRNDDPRLNDLGQIDKATERAANLTRQLLAFGGRQVLQPHAVDLNRLIRDMDKMLPRLVGEDVEVRFLPAPDLWKAKVDPGTIDRILVNLAVNAREAMPEGGRLTIETRNVALDEEQALGLAVETSGDYVGLAVSDNGCGMDAATCEQIFEPFFSTKKQGTGLGLSTVYGVVRQQGGVIRVHSEPGVGTTLQVHLPRTREEVGARESVEPKVERRPARGDETVLVIEDDELLLPATVRLLELIGYNVLHARDGIEAEEVAKRHQGPIHLLVTDLVMPRRGGPETAECIVRSRPEMKVLYMSGYTDSGIVHHGVLDAGIEFVEKPFSLESLGNAVRRALERTSTSAG